MQAGKKAKTTQKKNINVQQTKFSHKYIKVYVYGREAAVKAREGCVPLCINIYEYIVCYIIMVGDWRRKSIKHDHVNWVVWH